MLLPLVDLSAVHFPKRCASIVATSDGSKRSIIHFTDGTTHEADIVIGADGIKSAVRAAVVSNDSGSVAFTNTHAYRALVPLDDVLAAGVESNLFTSSRMFLGQDKVSHKDSKQSSKFRIHVNLQHLVIFPVLLNGKTLVRRYGNYAWI